MFNWIVNWVDENLSPTVQHIILAFAWYLVLGVSFGYFLGFSVGNAWGAAWALGWNSSREERDAEKGSGFGWKTLLIPDACVILMYILLEVIF